jgi:hypothetical protein
MLELFSGDHHRLIARQIFCWEEEISILRTVPGFTTQIGRNHRTGKQKLAHQWLHGLRVDFEAVYYYNLALLNRTSGAEWPNMTRTLRRLKLTFYKRAALLKICLLCRIPKKEKIFELVAAFEELIGYGWVIQDGSATLECSVMDFNGSL